MLGTRRKAFASVALGLAVGGVVAGGGTPPSAEAATTYKLPWAKGEVWEVSYGNHGANYNAIAWDFAPTGGFDNNPVAAVATGSAKLVCQDGWGQATVQLTVPGAGEFLYRHLTTASVKALGITEAGVSVQQGAVVGRLHPDPPSVPFEDTRHRCGRGDDPHLHLELPRLPMNIDGYSFTETSPGNGADLLSSNEVGGAESASSEGGHAVVSTPSGRLWMFGIQQDGTLRYRWTGGEGWGSWQTFSGSYRSVTATIDEGQVWILVTTSTGVMKYATYAPSTDSWSWSAAQSAGYDWANVSATTDADGRVWMFATTASKVNDAVGRLYYKRQNADGTWTGMTEIGNGGWAGISSTLKGSDVWVFGVKSADAAANKNRLYYFKSSGGTMGASPTEFGDGGFAGDVSVSTDKSGRVWALAPRTDGDLEYRYTATSGWVGPGDIGAGSWAGVSSGVKTDSGLVYVFATKDDGKLYYYRSTIGSTSSSPAGGSWDLVDQVTTPNGIGGWL
ncbi:hypothetical protein [Nocardioides stalactiti]|uniref:hypothetical protein n=1 Tax=Nocardioides stalactiti TaxID=2755356 RepID=UPI0015FEB9DD|nr:hypothetical protein [Nocardioides stalactiti]